MTRRTRIVGERAPKTSRLDRLLESARGRAEYASADLTEKVRELVLRGFDESTTTASAVAQALGVTEGRVSQIRNGDGNLRISTLAKVFDALGKHVEIVIRDRGATTVAEAAAAARATTWQQEFISDYGVHRQVYQVATPGHEYRLIPAGPPRQQGRTQVRVPPVDWIWNPLMADFDSRHAQKAGAH
jgi:transcriptional regulator with XRE-family HTH domain